MTKPYVTNCLTPVKNDQKTNLEKMKQVKTNVSTLAKSNPSDHIELARELLADALRREASMSSQKIVEPFPEELVTDSLKWSESERQRHFENGLSLIAQGKVAVVTLAGGQGTRLGSSHPKGCFDIGLKSNKNLFDLQAGRIQRLEELARKTFQCKSQNADTPLIKWAVMTSPATHQETVAFFRKHYPSNKAPLFFIQGQLPCFREEAPNEILRNSSSDVCKVFFL